MSIWNTGGLIRRQGNTIRYWRQDWRTGWSTYYRKAANMERLLGVELVEGQAYRIRWRFLNKRGKQALSGQLGEYGRLTIRKGNREATGLCSHASAAVFGAARALFLYHKASPFQVSLSKAKAPK